MNNNNQGGALNTGHTNSDVNYEPSDRSPVAETPMYVAAQMPLSGTTQQVRIAKTDDFAQAGAYYRKLAPDARTRLVENLAADLGQVKDARIKAKIVGFMLRADGEYGERVAKAVGVPVQDARATTVASNP